jgi:predicted Zn-dependent protease
MSKRLNVRLLTRVGAIIVLGLALLHILHLVQVARIARDFLIRAKQAEDDREYSRCALYLGRYLSLRPDDWSTEGKYGLALEKVASTPSAQWRAYYVLERVLRRDPGNVDVRQTLGALAIRLKRLDTAIHFLEPLRQAAVDQAELEDTLGWCYLGQGDTGQALKGFRAAIRRQPSRISSYENLTKLHLRHNQRTAADRVMDELIANNPKSAAAYVSRARYREGVSRVSEAASDFAQAVSLGRTDVVILMHASGFYLRNGRPDEARPLLEQAIKVRDRDVRPVLELARLEHDSGRPAAARALLETTSADDNPQVIAVLAELLIEQRAVGKVVALTRRLPEESPFKSYIEACRQMHDGKYVQALRKLEPLAHSLSNHEGWPARVQLAIARCHAGCNDGVRHREAVQRAVALEPTWRAARVALAEGLTRVGKLDEACKIWKRLMSETEPPSAGWLAYPRTLARRNLQPSLTPLDWQEVHNLLDRAEQAKSDPVSLALARVEVLVLKDQLPDAERLLLRELGRLGEKLPLILALADTQASQGKLSDALLVLKKYTNPEARAARIRHVSQLHGRTPDAVEAIRIATQDIDRLSHADAACIYRTWAEEARARGELRESLDICRRWCRQCPQDLAALTTRTMLADQLISEEDLRDVVAGLRHIEGDDGIRWRCAEVMRLMVLLRDRNADAAALVRNIRRLLIEAEGFGRATSAGLELVATLRGRLLEAAGRDDDAVAEYLLAFERGERREVETNRLAQMLLERNRLIEADRLLRRVDQEGVSEMPTREPFALFPSPLAVFRLLTPTLARIGAEVAVRQRDHTRAVELGVRALPGDSGSHRDRLWLAEVHDRAGRVNEAVRILERLTEKAGEIGDVWVALVRQYLRAGQREKSEDVLPRAQKQLASGDDGWQLALGECHEALGRLEQAERLYQLALKASPHNPLVLRRVASFHIAADQPENAIPLLMALATSPYDTKGHVSWARRSLATVPFQLVILKRPIPRAYREQLDEESLMIWLASSKETREETANERARALLIGSRPGREREGLKRFDKTLTPRLPLTPEEQLRLAQLRDLAGDPTRADEALDDLLKQERFSGQFAAAQVRLHLSRGDRVTASRALTRLLELEPDTERTRALQAECEK